MADSKISALAAVTTVGNTDEYVTTVAGATKKITGANLKAAMAPVGGTYITQVAESGLSAEQSLAALATGILKSTTTTGVLSIAAGSDLPTGIPIAKLADPTTGKVIGSTASAAAAVYPPGFEFGYDEITSDVVVASTTEASGTAIISCAAHTFDGGPVIAEFFAPDVLTTLVNQGFFVSLFEGATQIGELVVIYSLGANTLAFPVIGKLRFTPTAAAHTYTITAYKASGAGTCTVQAGASGTAAKLPAYVRFTKV